MISQLKCIKLQGHWIVVSSYRQCTNKLTINYCLTVAIDRLKGTNDITSLHSHLIDQSDQELEFHTINWRDTTHFYSDYDYHRGCWNSVTVNSPIQLYVHLDDHTQCIYIKLLVSWQVHISCLFSFCVLQPCGVDYELKTYISESPEEKPHKRWPLLKYYFTNWNNIESCDALILTDLIMDSIFVVTLFIGTQ